MKKLLMLLAVCALFISCGPKLKENGQFGENEYIGSFRDINIYRVYTPEGRYLYIGIREDGSLASTQYSTGGKTPIEVPIIIIDDKKVSVEEARKLLEPTITIDGKTYSKEEAIKIIGEMK